MVVGTFADCSFSSIHFDMYSDARICCDHINPCIVSIARRCAREREEEEEEEEEEDVGDPFESSDPPASPRASSRSCRNRGAFVSARNSASSNSAPWRVHVCHNSSSSYNRRASLAKSSAEQAVYSPPQ